MTKWCSSNEVLSHKYVYDTTGEYHRTSNENFSFKGNDLYSYYTRIASIDRKKKRIIMLRSYPTKTTTRHLFLLQQALPDNYVKVYSDCFVWKDLYKTFMKEIQQYYKQTHHKRKNNILSRIEDRNYLTLLKQNLEAINKYEYFKKHHKDLYDFIESNVQYESKRIEVLQNKHQKAAEERNAHRREVVNALENFLNSEECEKRIKYIIERENISNNNLINRVKISKVLLEDLTEYINVNRHLIKDKNISLYFGILYNTIYTFIQNRIFCIPKKESGYYYDVVYFDHDNLTLQTNRSITIQTDKNYLKSIIKMIKLYLSGKHFDLLIGKHVGPYTILKINAYQIQIGCHTFHYNNIKMLYNELKQYEMEK